MVVGFGLTSPPRNNTLKRQLKIAARTENGQSSYVRARRIWSGADISIQAWNRSSDGVYGTIIHELAHAAHREVDKSAYNSLVYSAYTYPCGSTAVNPYFNSACELPKSSSSNNTRRLMETWATTVETVFVLHRYRITLRRPSFIYGNDSNFQRRTIIGENHYTSAGYDMIDNVNQRDVYGARYPIDRVTGYEIDDLEISLKGARTWIQWRDNIKNRYSNSTENRLNELFANWPD